MIIFIYMCKVIDKCSIDNKQLHVIIESVIHVGNSEEKQTLKLMTLSLLLSLWYVAVLNVNSLH